ncbi:MAG: hypothetical protein BWY57_03086 [Betaproteobacteria bacterium ADurb.Bin341]|nr:MAG: hypothetical protein BWY57_03086 [Betaproteobacteria bacterium ADurb.Bin341]
MPDTLFAQAADLVPVFYAVEARAHECAPYMTAELSRYFREQVLNEAQVQYVGD